MDVLRQKSGQGVILRGHDFVLRGTRLTAEPAPPKPVLQIVVRKRTATYYRERGMEYTN